MLVPFYYADVMANVIKTHVKLYYNSGLTTNFQHARLYWYEQDCKEAIRFLGTEISELLIIQKFSLNISESDYIKLRETPLKDRSFVTLPEIEKAIKQEDTIQKYMRKILPASWFHD